MAGRDEKDVILSISHRTLWKFTVYYGVFTGMVLSILSSLYFSYDSVTGTHCRVPNILPTISASFRDLPSRFIWQLGVICHLPRAFLDVCLYHCYFAGRLDEMKKTGFLTSTLNRVQSLVLIVHHMSLLTLTLVTSASDFYVIHEAAFISFIVTSFLHMILFLAMLKVTSSDGHGLRTMRSRVAYFISHVILFAVSMYLFVRHNTYCEAYMYTLYAGIEYFVVVTNILFYCDVNNDFPDLKLILVGSARKTD